MQSDTTAARGRQLRFGHGAWELALLLALVAPCGLVFSGRAIAALDDARQITTSDGGTLGLVRINMPAGAHYRFYVASSTGVSDPVLHLVHQTASGQWLWGASNDDWVAPPGSCSPPPGAPGVFEPTDPCLEWTNAAPVTRQVQLFVHAYRKPDWGTAGLVVWDLATNALVSTHVVAVQGDRRIVADDGNPVEWAAADRLDVAFQGDGTMVPAILALRGTTALAGWGYRGSTADASIDVWGQPRIPVAWGASYVSGAPEKTRPAIVLASSTAGPQTGSGRLLVFRNDVGQADADGDGLGDHLEAHLGTSSASTDADPQDGIADGVDTDLDGFPDALEVIGGAHHPLCVGDSPGPTLSNPGGECAINLGVFGADPTIVNVFGTLVWMRASDGSDPVAATLEDILEPIQASFSASEGYFGNLKPHVDLLIDYGQASLGGFAVGGGKMAWQQTVCVNELAHPDCTTVGAPPCQVDADCPGPPRDFCVAGRCEPVWGCTDCDRYGPDNPHPVDGDIHAPWNLERMYWGPFPLFPRGRRALSIPMTILNARGDATDLPSDRDGFFWPTWYPEWRDAVPSAKAVWTGWAGLQLDIAADAAKEAYARNVFMHELGHGLRLSHNPLKGGWNYQPNHVSVMNYGYSGSGVNGADGEWGDSGEFLDYGGETSKDAAGALTARPTLESFGATVPGAATETECCCGSGDCLGEFSELTKEPDCTTWWPLVYNLDQAAFPPQCTRCEAAVWIPGAAICIVYPTPTAQAGEPVFGTTEEQCCCGGGSCAFSLQVLPAVCPRTTAWDPNDEECRVCNAHWIDGQCRYGGLAEGQGIGSNLDGPTHEDLLAANMSKMVDHPGYPCAGLSHVPSAGPFSIDWDCNDVGTATSLPEEGTSATFMHQPGTYNEPPPQDASFPAVDEWGMVVDALSRPEVPDGTQGMGVFAYCDASYACPAGQTCTNGWCLLPGQSWPRGFVFLLPDDPGGAPGAGSDPPCCGFPLE